MNGLVRVKPVLLSKRMLKTNRVNEKETWKLKEEIDKLDFLKTQMSIEHQGDLQELRQTIRDIKEVKQQMEVGIERRRFLVEHGIQTSRREMNMNDFVAGIDNFVLKSKKTEGYRIMPMATTLASKRRGKSETNCIEEEVPGSAYLDLTVQGHRRPVSEVVKEKSRKDLERPLSAPVFNTNRPKYLFREIIPPLRGRKVEEVYKQLEEEAKLLQQTKEKELTFQRGYKTTKTQTSVQNAPQFKAAPAKNSKPVKEMPQSISARSDYVDSGKEIEVKSRTSSLKEKITVDLENIASTSLDFTAEENSFEEDSEISLLGRKISETKFLDAEESDKPAANVTCSDDMTAVATGLEADPVRIKRDSLSTPAETHLREQIRTAWDGNELREDFNLKKNEFDHSDQHRELLRQKWKQLVEKTRQNLRQNEIRALQEKMKKSRKQSKRRRLNEGNSEAIIYDARPDKAVTKGYSLMRMTIGKKAVSIFMPAFKNDTTFVSQLKSRANVKSNSAAQLSKIKREARVSNKQSQDKPGSK